MTYLTRQCENTPLKMLTIRDQQLSGSTLNCWVSDIEGTPPARGSGWPLTRNLSMWDSIRVDCWSSNRRPLARLTPPPPLPAGDWCVDRPKLSPHNAHKYPLSGGNKRLLANSPGDPSARIDGYYRRLT